LQTLTNAVDGRLRTVELAYAPATGLTSLTGTVTTLDDRLRLVERSYATSTAVSTLQTLTGGVDNRLALVESSYASRLDGWSLTMGTRRRRCRA
jgi:hypothetical protein